VVLVTDPVHLPREVHDLLRREDLAGARLAAQPSGEVQRTAAVAALDTNRFPGVETDPDWQRQRRIVTSLAREPNLQVDGRADRATRGLEDGEGLVAAELDDVTSARGDDLARERREPPGEAGRSLVAAFLREHGPAADVGDQERQELGDLIFGSRRLASVIAHRTSQRGEYAAPSAAAATPEARPLAWAIAVRWAGMTHGAIKRRFRR
jgi:hypothetical protein